jgi:hypothetical protein
MFAPAAFIFLPATVYFLPLSHLPESFFDLSAS